MSLVLGLMSGTSADGISVAIVDIRGERLKLIAFKNYLFPEPIRDKILKGPGLSIAELAQLNFDLGHLFAKAALRLLNESKISAKKVSVVGSHGQTVYHKPKVATLQIGEPAVIVEKLGVPVVANFRPRDIAAGGEGAPLIPYFDWFYFRGEAPVALQNIGGIANVTVVTRKKENVLAFDTGPGNCLLDQAILIKTRRKWSYDRNSYWAKKGHSNVSLIEKALRHFYFLRRPPKSTGRELFGESFLSQYFGALLERNLPDLAATLTAFTAETIALAYKKFILPNFSIKKIIASGGGTKNPLLIATLRKKVSVPIFAIEEYGIPTQAKEPMAFALMAYQALRKKPNHIPQATGAKGPPRILGEITEK